MKLWACFSPKDHGNLFEVQNGMNSLKYQGINEIDLVHITIKQKHTWFCLMDLSAMQWTKDLVK